MNYKSPSKSVDVDENVHPSATHAKMHCVRNIQVWRAARGNGIGETVISSRREKYLTDAVFSYFFLICAACYFHSVPLY
jgi:hypothetical protein